MTENADRFASLRRRLRIAVFRRLYVWRYHCLACSELLEPTDDVLHKHCWEVVEGMRRLTLARLIEKAYEIELAETPVEISTWTMTPSIVYDYRVCRPELPIIDTRRIVK